MAALHVAGHGALALHRRQACHDCASLASLHCRHDVAGRRRLAGPRRRAPSSRSAAPCSVELVTHDDWLPESMARCPSHGYAANLLWCDPFERFSIMSLVRAPGAETPVHDHQVWGLVGILRGAQASQRFVLDPASGALASGQPRHPRSGRGRGCCRRPTTSTRWPTRERRQFDQHPRPMAAISARMRRAPLRSGDRRGERVRVGLRQPRDAEFSGIGYRELLSLMFSPRRGRS
mgnify:CR=1 FL=1